jgi:hypothetical protein
VIFYGIHKNVNLSIMYIINKPMITIIETSFSCPSFSALPNDSEIQQPLDLSSVSV